jgi:hypothetical protein
MKDSELPNNNPEEGVISTETEDVTSARESPSQFVDAFAAKVEQTYSKENARALDLNPVNLMKWVEAIMDLMAVCQKTPREYREIAQRPNMVQRIRIRRALNTHFNEDRQSLNNRATALCNACVNSSDSDLAQIEREFKA